MMEEAENDLAIIIVKSIFMCIFIALGIIGNCTVIVSIKKYQKLQTIPNFFVFNLAIADLLFSLTGMPMILVTTICEKWVLGDFLCKVNGLLNSLFCTTSIWTLVMISVNRYLSVAKAHDIKKIYTVKKTYVIIGGVWIFSFLISMPPLVGWSEFVPGSNFCTVNGKSGLSYGVLLIFMDYFFPLLLLAGLYLRIFFLLRQNKAAMVRARNVSILSSPDNTLDDSPSSVTVDYNTDSDSVTFSDSKSSDTKYKKVDRRILALLRKKHLMGKSCLKSQTTEESPLSTLKNNESVDVVKKEEKLNFPKEVKQDVPSPIVSQIILNTSGNNNSRSSSKVVRICSDKEESTVKRVRSFKRRKHISSFKKFFNELDVTKMLLIVVLAFFLCWTTFMISSILFAFNALPEEYRLVTFGIYIACLNSIINPLIYALMNRNFRHYFNALYRDLKKSCMCCAV